MQIGLTARGVKCLMPDPCHLMPFNKQTELSGMELASHRFSRVPRI